MQIRLRRTNGLVIELPEDAKFIELLDLDGNPGIVIIAGHQQIKICRPGDEEFRNYVGIFSLKPSEVKTIPMPSPE
jgi:hypothetical protein